MTIHDTAANADEIVDLQLDEIDTVAGGLFGVGIITTPVGLGAISGGVAGWLPGSISPATWDGGRWGWAAETGSLLEQHYRISQELMFDILRQ